MKLDEGEASKKDPEIHKGSEPEKEKEQKEAVASEMNEYSSDGEPTKKPKHHTSAATERTDSFSISHAYILRA